MKALVAEDHEQMRNQVSDILSAQGFEVISVAEGKAAMQALRNQRFDLIVTDNQMGENRALWGVAVIKMANLHSHVYKTILMSTENVEDHKADAFIAKGDGFKTRLEEILHQWFNEQC